MADVLYRDWILGYLVKEMNQGKKFSEELSLDELQEISERVISNEMEKRIKEVILSGEIADGPAMDTMKTILKEEWLKGGNRRFFEIMKDELKDIPVEVYVNIKGTSVATFEPFFH